MTAPSSWLVSITQWKTTPEGLVEAKQSGSVRHLVFVGESLCRTPMTSYLLSTTSAPVGQDLPICSKCADKSRALALSWGLTLETP